MSKSTVRSGFLKLLSAGVLGTLVAVVATPLAAQQPDKKAKAKDVAHRGATRCPAPAEAKLADSIGLHTSRQSK